VIKVGSLCSGYGGLELALGHRPSWYAEVDPNAAGLLAHHWPDVPNLGDIKQFTDAPPVDLITVGFPCQPTSAAGRQLGELDGRWLWPDVIRIVRAVRPAQVFIENVRNLVSIQKGVLWRGILDDLSESGYGVRWTVVGACHLGMAHHRHRVFALATLGAAGVERIDMTPCGASRPVVLLPTMTARDGDGRGEGDALYWTERLARRKRGLPLGATVALLPTPRASDGVNGGPNQRGSSGDLALPSAVVGSARWDVYADAVTRQEEVTGVPAPDPTEPNRNGSPRLSARFAEWLMGIPAGHVTDHLDRLPALKAIGNGVVPRQAAYAFALLRGDEMPPKSKDDGADAMRQLHVGGARDIVTAVAAAGGGLPVDVAESLARAALDALTEVLRAQATYISDQRKQGHVSTSKELTQAASRVVGYALRLNPLPSDATMRQLVSWLANEPGDVQPAISAQEFLHQQVEKLSLIGDGAADALDYLSGKTETYGPPIVTTVPSIEGGGLTVPALNITRPESADVAVSVVDPFTDPGGWKPSTVDRLSWDAFTTLAEQLKTEPAEFMSVSKAETLASCGVKHALGRLSRRGVVEPARPQWALIGGSTFHEAVEMIERGTHPESVGAVSDWWTYLLDREVKEQLDGTSFTLDDIRPSRGGREGYDWWRVEGAEMVIRYLRHHDDAWRARNGILYLDTQRSTPAIELEFKMPLDVLPAVTVHGFIDQIWADGSTPFATSVDLVDLKTGSTPGSMFQLAVYAHAAQRVFGVQDTVRAANWLAREGRYTEFVDPTIAHPWEEIQHRFRVANVVDRAGLFMANPSSFCGGCAHESICPSRQGV
jgi:DNA (cytosine-5)-methyltransferase 1